MAGVRGVFPIQQMFNGGELSPLLSYRIDQQRYAAGCKLLENFLPMAQGPMMRRPGFRFLGEVAGGASTRLFPFVFSANQTRVIEAGPGYMRFWTSDGVILGSDGQPYTISTVFDATDLVDMRMAQMNDVIYITNIRRPIYKLMRYGDTDWRLTTPSFQPSVSTPYISDVTFEGSNPATGVSTVEYVATVVDADTGDESYPSAAVARTSVADADGRGAITAGGYWAKVKMSYSQSGTSTNRRIQEFRVYKLRAGVYGYIGRVNANNAVVNGEFYYYKDDNVTADVADNPPSQGVSFSEAGNYPSICFFWQQRLGFASSMNKPLGMWLSKVGSFENFSTSVTVTDDDAIDVTLASSGQSKIQWVVGDKVLLMGTAGGEFTVTDLSGNPNITAKSIAFSRQSTLGSVGLDPIVANGNVLFLQRGTNEIREFVYDYNSDKWVAPSLIILATHLLQDKAIVRWAWQQSLSHLWCLLNDGTMICCTYMKEHDVVGWHRHKSTNGFIVDICTVPGPIHDQLFALVRRTINGVQKYYMEVLANPFISSDARHAFFVDSGLTYNGNPISTVTGLNHLEGQSVSIFADGATMLPRTVTSGSIKLDRPASIIHIGLPYESTAILNKPEIVVQQMTTLSHDFNITKAVVRFYQSMNARVGTTTGSMRDVLKHSTANPLFPKFKTGDEVVDLAGGWSTDTAVKILVEDPVPVTVSGVTYAVKFAPSI